MTAIVSIIPNWPLQPELLGAGAIALGFILWRIVEMIRRRGRPGRSRAPQAQPFRPGPRQPVDPGDTDALVEQMLAQGRYALLLRPQVAKNLREEQFERIKEALMEAMAVVPEGEVFVSQSELPGEEGDGEESADRRGRVAKVGCFFLDRYPVTNRQYYEFVAANGYEQISFWDQSIWPEVLNFVDQTGQPGPRLWKGGCFEPGREDHPVVGVSWHEAVAYARWVGKRLPTDAEWVKAASWPVKLGPDSQSQRRYPWGEVMDRSRANTWGSSPKGTVPVSELPDGMSVGGVYQLIGNVWEWTRGNYAPGDHSQGRLVLDVPLKSIRGGAFDTYFESQATCQFQSGELATRRKRNIGFRCALGACDLVLARPVEHRRPEPAATPEPAEEVQV